MLNRTHLEHTVIALVIQFIASPLIGAVASGALALFLLLGREIAQHEYKIALGRGWQWGSVKPVAWYEGFTSGWSVDSVLDLLVPAAACAVVAVFAQLL